MVLSAAGIFPIAANPPVAGCVILHIICKSQQLGVAPENFASQGNARLVHVQVKAFGLIPRMLDSVCFLTIRFHGEWFFIVSFLFIPFMGGGFS